MRYLLCGRCAESDLALPLPPAGPDEHVDLRITLQAARSPLAGPPTGNEILAEAHWDGGQGLTHVRTASGYRLRYFSYCEAVVSADLSAITVTLAPDRTEEDAALFVIGGITAFMLTLQGRPPLHGSAVCHAGRTLAFLGASGGGKSTLAALYCLDGATLFTDDLLALGPGDHVLQGSTELRLRAPAREVAGYFPAERMRTSADGRFAIRWMAPDQDAPPLSALVVPLLSDDARGLAVRRLGGSEAFLALASSPRQLGVKDPALIRDGFAYVAAICRRLPVLEAVVPIARLRDRELPLELSRRLEELL
jgi:hypothetical protein